MSRRTAAAAAIAAVSVIGVAGAAVAATGPGMGYGNGYGNGNGNGQGTAVGSPLHDGSRGPFGGWGRADGSGGRGAGGQGLGARGQGSGAAMHGSDVPAAVPNATISPDVADMLAFMVQEEKLARDVYALAIDEYGDRVFVNINRAESNHMAELQVLLDRYDVADPTANAAPGAFTEDELTGMYADLAGTGRHGPRRGDRRGGRRGDRRHRRPEGRPEAGRALRCDRPCSRTCSPAASGTWQRSSATPDRGTHVRQAPYSDGSPAAGSSTQKVAPRPGGLSTPTVPPCACTIAEAIARPSPLPPEARARATSAR